MQKLGREVDNIRDAWVSENKILQSSHNLIISVSKIFKTKPNWLVRDVLNHTSGKSGWFRHEKQNTRHGRRKKKKRKGRERADDAIKRPTVACQGHEGLRNSISPKRPLTKRARGGGRLLKSRASGREAAQASLGATR